MADNTETPVEETEDVVEEADVQETEQELEDDGFGLEEDHADETHVTFVEGGEIVDFDEEEEDEDEEEDAVETDGVEAMSGEEQDEDDEEEEDEEATGTDEEAQTPDSDEDEDSADAPTDPAATATATEPPSETDSPETKTAPLPFKVDGKEFTVEGREDGDNYVIPKEEWNRKIQPRLADKTSWHQERESYRRQIAALDPQKNPEVERARQITSAFQDLLDKGPDAVVEWAEDFDRNKEVLMAKAEAAAARAEADQYKGVHDQQDQTARVQETQAQLEQGIEALVGRALQNEKYANLDAEHLKKLLKPMSTSIFFRAQEDLPQFGVKRGEIGVNMQVVGQVLESEAERDRAYREKINAASAASEARKRNDAILKKDKKPAPAPAGKEVSDPTPRNTKPPRTKEEWSKRLNALARG